jgi:hypothetical protein
MELLNFKINFNIKMKMKIKRDEGSETNGKIPYCSYAMRHIQKQTVYYEIICFFPSSRVFVSRIREYNHCQKLAVAGGSPTRILV